MKKKIKKRKGGGAELKCHGNCVCWWARAHRLLFCPENPPSWSMNKQQNYCPETKLIKTAFGIDRKTSPIVQVRERWPDPEHCHSAAWSERGISERAEWDLWHALIFLFTKRPIVSEQPCHQWLPSVAWMAGLEPLGEGHLSFSEPKALPSACGFKS